jgi:branched-chain amino acid transport system ATP-binding protein
MLEFSRVDKRFGGLHAIRDLSITVPRHGFFGIIGPNGAGKTTLLNLATGYIRSDGGLITFEGNRIDRLRPFEVCRLGAARTFQIVRPFGQMSVEDNVMTGALFSQPRRISMAEARRRCELPLHLVGLSSKRRALAGTLTLGEKKKLELARALATEPRLLMLDEVMGGVPHADIDDLMLVLQRIHQAGTTILMIEHVIRVILELCDHVVVLNFGSKLFEGTPDDVISHPEVIESYLGKPLEVAGL